MDRWRILDIEQNRKTASDRPDPEARKGTAESSQTVGGETTGSSDESHQVGSAASCDGPCTLAGTADPT